jgi:ATP-dependent RNA helicase RhlE
MTFQDLLLAEPILRAVAAEGYTVPTPIQAQAIPHVLAGKDMFGCAQTGTGKTAAFALPILHRLSTTAPAVASSPAPTPSGRSNFTPHHSAGAGPRVRIRALVLSPTRELASQIGDSFRVYGKNTKIRGTVIFGGVGQGPQVSALRNGVEVVVATPGRLLDLMEQGHVDLRGVEVLVLDEADRMLDMGFIHDIRKIVAKVPKERQTLFFSATMPDAIRQLAGGILRNPVNVQVAAVSSTAERVEQSLYSIDKPHKSSLLIHLINATSITRALVFTRTKHGADRVVRHLFRAGIKADAIHGNKTQNNRQRALANFKAGKTPVLVATDIAARGIDVDGISHVFNYDIPNEPESYVHRIGRTARAGASGIAISFCDYTERGFVKHIERLTRQKIAVSPMPTGFKATAQPVSDADRASSPHHVHVPAHRPHASPRPSHREGPGASAHASNAGPGHGHSSAPNRGGKKFFPRSKPRRPF